MTRTLHGFPLSGHSHKVELFLHLLDLPYQYERAGPDQRQTPQFQALNPLGQIPVLVEDGLVLADSHAILTYLACRYDPTGPWLSADPVAAAQVQRWLALSAGELRFGPAMARVIKLFGRPGDLVAAQAMAAKLFHLMETHLTASPWLVGDSITLADIACYSYSKRAPDGGIALDPYPALLAWLGRIEALPRFLPMPTELPK